jgi:hypothetical protein
MKRSESVFAGFVVGMTSLVAVALAAPTCYDVEYQRCTGSCGAEGGTVTVCESSFNSSATGKYKGTATTEPRQCYTYTQTATSPCNNTWEGYVKIPNCANSSNPSLCCWVKADNPPTVTNGTGNIIRLNPIQNCVGTGTPSAPF